jgi:hypothetical protein
VRDERDNRSRRAAREMEQVRIAGGKQAVQVALRRIATSPKEKGHPSVRWVAFRTTPGSDLLSHTVTHAVPSAVEGLTSVFGMGTGVTPLLWPPGN